MKKTLTWHSPACNRLVCPVRSRKGDDRAVLRRRSSVGTRCATPRRPPPAGSGPLSAPRTRSKCGAPSETNHKYYVNTYTPGPFLVRIDSDKALYLLMILTYIFRIINELHFSTQAGRLQELLNSPSFRFIWSWKFGLGRSLPFLQIFASSILNSMPLK